MELSFLVNRIYNILNKYRKNYIFYILLLVINRNMFIFIFNNQIKKNLYVISQQFRIFIKYLIIYVCMYVNVFRISVKKLI